MNEQNKKRTLIVLYIVIGAIIVLVGAATYAYFSSSQNIESNVGVAVNISGDSYTFMARSTGNIAMDITPAMMDEAISNNLEAIANDTANIIVELTSPDNNTSTTCTYDIIWQWTSDDIYTNSTVGQGKNKVSPTTGAINEFTTLIDNTDETNIALKTFITDTYNFVVGTKSITSASTTAVVQTHEIMAKFYNLEVSQDALKGKQFSATITVDNVNCTMETSD